MFRQIWGAAAVALTHQVNSEVLIDKIVVDFDKEAEAVAFKVEEDHLIKVKIDLVDSDHISTSEILLDAGQERLGKEKSWDPVVSGDTFLNPGVDEF